MKTELGLTNAQVGYFMTAALAGYAIFLIPGGWVVDKVGVRWTLCIGQVCAGICLLCVPLSATVAVGMVAMFMAGTGLGFLVPATTKGVVEWFPVKERATAMGIKQTSVNAGGVITASLMPMVAIVFGWRWGFAGLGFVAIISGIIAAILYKSPPLDKAVTLDATSVGETGISAPPEKKETWLVVFKSREVYLLVIAATTLFITELGVLTYFVLYLKSYLLIPVVTAGFMLASLDIGGFFGKPITGIISDRVFGGKRKMTFIIMGGISVILAGVFAIMQTDTPRWLVVVCAVIFGFAAIGWSGLWHTMIGECAGKEHTAMVVGVGLAFVMGVTAFAVPIFGRLADITGSWTWSWIYLVVMGVIGTVSVCLVREEKRRLSC
jgi:sugar phosphate permease